MNINGADFALILGVGLLLVLQLLNTVFTISVFRRAELLRDISFRMITTETLVRQLTSIVQMDSLENKYDELLNNSTGTPNGSIMFAGPDQTMYTGSSAEEIIHKIRQNPNNKLSEEQIHQIRNKLESLIGRMDSDMNEDDDEQDSFLK